MWPIHLNLLTRIARTRLKLQVACLASWGIVSPVKRASIRPLAPFSLFITAGDSVHHKTKQSRRPLDTVADWVGQRDQVSRRRTAIFHTVRTPSLSWTWCREFGSHPPWIGTRDPRYLERNTLFRGRSPQRIMDLSFCFSTILQTFTTSSVRVPRKFSASFLLCGTSLYG